VHDTLPLVLPEGISLDTVDGVGRTLRRRIDRLLRGIEHIDPFKFGWVRDLKCYPKEFDRWLKASSPGISWLPRQKRPSDEVVRRVVQDYVNLEQSTGHSTSIPRMWNCVKKEVPGATRAQAIKALQDIVGPKKRGRPWGTTSARK
jgi:hypothetical protein